MLSQMPVEEKLATNATAQTLLRNLLNYGTEYKLTFRPTTVTASASSQLAQSSRGHRPDSRQERRSARGDSASRARKSPIIEATPDNLTKLADRTWTR